MSIFLKRCFGKICKSTAALWAGQAQALLFEVAGTADPWTAALPDPSPVSWGRAGLGAPQLWWALSTETTSWAVVSLGVCAPRNNPTLLKSEMWQCWLIAIPGVTLGWAAALWWVRARAHGHCMKLSPWIRKAALTPRLSALMFKACGGPFGNFLSDFLLEKEFCKQGKPAKTWDDIYFSQAKLFS